jgi:hypothetical protein
MENSYFGVKAISNTALGYINPDEKGCPEKFFDFIEGRAEKKETKAMITGTLIHSLILEPGDISVLSVPKISDNVKRIVERIFNEYYDEFSPFSHDLSQLTEQIVQVAKEENYGQNWKTDTMVNKIRSEGGDEYFRLMIENIGKTIVTEDIFANLLKIESAIKLNPAAKELLLQDDAHGIEYLNELEIYFTHNDVQCKAKIDRLLIDTILKIFKIVDLKTTSESVEYFPNIFNSRHMYRQLAMYETAVQEYLKEHYPDENYTPGTHSIIACETTGYGRIRRFDVSKGLIDKGHAEKDSLINRIKWHIDNNERLHSMEDFYSEFCFILEEENS